MHTDRRQFLKHMTALMGVMAVAGNVTLLSSDAASAAIIPHKDISQRYPFTLPSLPYAKDALQPAISSETLDFHHGKHHQGYVENLNRLAKEAGMTDKSLQEIILLSADNKEHASLFNNAAQTWNHSFYWHSMSPTGGGTPQGRLADMMKQRFGSVENALQRFAEAGKGLFGSGWVWLVLDSSNKLDIITTQNAENPIVSGHLPLLVMDVWEHAYYLDTQNNRAEYITAFLHHLAHWDYAERILNMSLKS